jgi:hypothetical protein
MAAAGENDNVRDSQISDVEEGKEGHSHMVRISSNFDVVRCLFSTMCILAGPHIRCY